MKASIIICTYNEEKSIEEVIISCCTLNSEYETIVVDDGSTDKTGTNLNELSKNYSFRFVKLEKNMGKSWAIAYGVEIATYEIILFIDADVSNLQKEHFEGLLKPIFDKTADMVLGQPSETLIDYHINPFKVLTGERALIKEDLIPILNEIRDIRFGVETFLNLYYQANGKRVKYVLLKGLKHPSTFEKTGSFGDAAIKYFKEGNEIAKTIANNYHLINQRVDFLLTSTDKKTKKKIDSLQNEINTKLQDLKAKLNI